MLKLLSLFLIMFSISCATIETPQKYPVTPISTSAGSLKSGQKFFTPSRQSKKVNSFFWPVQGQVVNFFQESVDSSINNGLNIQADSNNKTARACAAGRVVYSKELKGWGKTVILKHQTNIYTVYANLDKCLVKEGNSLNSKDEIGQVARGADGKYVLHFEVRKQYSPQDPLIYLN